MSDLLESISTYGWFGNAAGLEAIGTYGWFFDETAAETAKGIFVEMDGIFDEGIWF
jgi:hypothetical protein